MPPVSSPSLIAREVLKQLAARRMQPTPDNFRRLYAEVSGGSPEPPLPMALLRQIAAALPRNTAERSALAVQLDTAVSQYDHAGARQALLTYVEHLQNRPEPAWNTLIALLMREWNRPQSDWTAARKRHALQHVLAAHAPDTLYQRLNGLLQSWAATPTSPEAVAISVGNPTTAGANLTPEQTGTPPAPRVVGAGKAGEIIEHLHALLDVSLRHQVPAFLAEHPALAQEAQRLADLAREADNAPAVGRLIEPFRQYAYRLELAAGENAQLQQGRQRLFRLLLNDLPEITLESDWLEQQVQQLREIEDGLANPAHIDEAEHLLRRLISTQSQLKHNLLDAQQRLYKMLAEWVDELARFAHHTETYQTQLAEHATQMENARKPDEIGRVLAAVMHDTRTIQHETARSHDELETARQAARAAEQRAARLERQLHAAHRDWLTPALSRAGLEHVFARLSAQTTRSAEPLTLIRLDILNLQALRRQHGHPAGEQAMTHLAEVIMEPLDSRAALARLDGGNFALLCAGLDARATHKTLQQLHRRLERTWFVVDEQRVFVRFQAGQAQWQAGESLRQTLARAQTALAAASTPAYPAT